MKKAFTMVEMLIVVAILGILAAIIIPILQNHTTQARETTAKENLFLLRNAIERYAAANNGIAPGYNNNDTSIVPNGPPFRGQLVLYGKYLSELPENPFNGQIWPVMISNAEAFPSKPLETDTKGWVYKPATKEIRLNWPGTDSQGVDYFDY